MSKTKCYSVKLKSLRSISDKCYLAECFDGRKDLIPKSQVYGMDYDRCSFDEDSEKGDAWWISEWILARKNIQYSTKREAWIDFESDEISIVPKVKIERHVPEKIEVTEIQIEEELIK